MKIRTVALLASLGVVLSTAAAFAVPLAPRALAAAEVSLARSDGVERAGARVSIGDTLLVDARLGHASLARGGPSGTGETLLLAQVTSAAPGDGKSTSAPPLSLAIVVDRSGSMKGERIAKAIEASIFALERLREGDSITVVTFDTAAQVVVPPTRVSATARSRIEAAIRSIRLGGDTCISCGLEEGMRQLASVTHAADHVDRMLLLSDGVTNAGIRDVPGLRAMAGRMHGRGVTISTVGVDVDFDEKVMAAIAREANGRHHFVANASGLPAVFAEEFDEVLASTARGADLVLELAPGVEVAEVFDRSFHREGNRVIVPFGTFSARQEKTVLVRLRVPTALPGQVPVADVRLSYRDLVKRSDGACRGTLALDVREGGSEQKDLDPFVAARLERSRTAQTLTEASSLFEQGRVSEARTRLAQRRGDLAATQQLALALANVDAAQPGARPGRSLERDFGDQIGAVELADRNFAAAPPPPVAEDRVAAGRTEPTGGSAASGADVKGGFAPAPASREGRAQVKVNQQAATEFGF